MAYNKKSFPFSGHSITGQRQGAEGNAMVYVLVIVALFAALSFILARQSDTTEVDALGTEKAELYATEVQQSAMQVKQAIDQMIWTGSDPDDLDFITPDDVNFDTGTASDHAKKVFHPMGGGVTLPRITEEALATALVGPTGQGWHLGMVDNIEWTQSADPEIVMTAHQIRLSVCERINERLTGSTTVPVMSVQAEDTIIFNSGGNLEFTSAQCADCYGRQALCVQDSDNAYSFYSLIYSR